MKPYDPSGKKYFQLEIIKCNGTLKFRIPDPGMENIRIEIENPENKKFAVGQLWNGTVLESDGKKVLVRLINLVEKPQVDLVEELPNFWIDRLTLKAIQIQLLSNFNVLLIGPAGAGKTQFCKRLSEAWNCEILIIDCGNVGKTKDFFGSESAKDGSTAWQPSQLSLICDKAEQEPQKKYLVVFDEISRVHGRNSSDLHPFLEKEIRQTSFISTEGTIIVNLPKNVMVMATANIGTQYSGTYSIDNALRDRFLERWLDYPPPEFEIEWLVNKYPRVNYYQAEKIVAAANSLRQAAKNSQVDYAPSLRKTDATANLVQHGFDVLPAIEQEFLTVEKPLDENADMECEYNLIRSHIRKIIEDINI